MGNNGKLLFVISQELSLPKKKHKSLFKWASFPSTRILFLRKIIEIRYFYCQVRYFEVLEPIN